MPEAPLPHARFEIGPQLRNTSLNHFAVKKGKARDALTHRCLEVCLWPTPESCQESVDAIVWYRDLLNSAASDVAGNCVHGRTSALIERDDLREIRLSQPEAADVAGLKGQDHKAARNPHHFIETSAPIGPVMQRQYCERGAECSRLDRKRLGGGLDDRTGPTLPLLDHSPRWFDRYHDPADRLVGASASTDVDHRVDIAEGVKNCRGDSWVWTSRRCVRPSDLVVKSLSHAR
ncbi:MAG TPA: hypothetical protein VFS23_25305 [Vicinamibacterales bacterium]|nr:hypothetical protein [Vicinamibacterales bacterium]